MTTPLPDRSALDGHDWDDVDGLGMSHRDWMGFVKDNIDAAAASAGGDVSSVNSRTGAVVLTAADVGADAVDTAADLVATEASTRTDADAALVSAISAKASAAFAVAMAVAL